MACPIGGTALRDKRPAVIAALAAAELLLALVARINTIAARRRARKGRMSMTDDRAAPLRLELRGITKRFPGVVANSDVGFAVAPGEIHALLGENGAGKSTLVKIIYGVLHADEGEMLLGRQARARRRPRGGAGARHRHGVPALLAVRGDDRAGERGARRRRRHRHEGARGRVREVCHAYGLPLDPEREVHTLSVGERQRIEIVRCLLQNPRLLIMDEPTSVLTPQEVDKLFETLRLLAAEGCSILYISHKLHEIKALCDAATILRGGKVVGHCDPKVETARGMAQLMIGAELRTLVRREGRAPASRG